MLAAAAGGRRVRLLEADLDAAEAGAAGAGAGAGGGSSWWKLAMKGNHVSDMW